MQVPQPNEGEGGKPLKLLDRVRNMLRVMHLSKRTEEAYVAWISRFIYFHRDLRGEWVHPEILDGNDVSNFLTHLAVDREVAASTQN
jgi:Phage integrase, N-terminal SAM-like domain